MSNLILVRHGKAHKADHDQEDLKRSLTEKGEKDIRKLIKIIHERYETEAPIAVWTSPALRTEQTARIISEELEIEEPSAFDFILTGDYEELKKKVLASSDFSTIILVGHEPHLSNWCNQLVHTPLSFQKGTFVKIRIQESQELTGSLEWIRHPELGNEKKSGPHKPKDFSPKEMTQILQGIIEESKEQLNFFLEAPENPETVHQIRVCLRRLRALISLIRDQLNPESYNDHQDKLRRVARQFSKIRELDVLAEQWQDLLNSSNGFIRDSVLTQVLALEREKECNRVRAYLDEGAALQVLAEVKNWIESWQFPLYHNAEFSASIIKRLDKWNHSIKQGLKEFKDLSPSEIHRLRLLYKKVRYVQGSIKFLKKNKKWNLSELKQKQEELGYYCDVINNITLLREIEITYHRDGLSFEIGFLLGHQFPWLTRFRVVEGR